MGEPALPRLQGRVNSSLGTEPTRMLGEERQVGVRSTAEREEYEYSTLDAFVRAAPKRHREGWYVYGTHFRRDTGVLMVIWERVG
jgi:hypothetical protein